jgi:hypothetical protein
MYKPQYSRVVGGGFALAFAMVFHYAVSLAPAVRGMSMLVSNVERCFMLCPVYVKRVGAYFVARLAIPVGAPKIAGINYILRGSRLERALDDINLSTD